MQKNTSAAVVAAAAAAAAAAAVFDMASLLHTGTFIHVTMHTYMHNTWNMYYVHVPIVFMKTNVILLRTIPSTTFY